jgi:hypothetical protein
VSRVKAYEDKLLAASIENAMLREHLHAARTESQQWQRVATKFITQFSIVEKVFAEVKAVAVAQAAAIESGKLCPEADAEKAAEIINALPEGTT